MQIESTHQTFADAAVSGTWPTSSDESIDRDSSGHREPSPQCAERTSFEWAAQPSRSGKPGAMAVEFDGRSLTVLGVAGKSGQFGAIEQILVTRYDQTPGSDSIAARLKRFSANQCRDVHVVLSSPRAVVRHFLLPPVPPRQRHAAALWEGQKLIPFSLKDGGALHSVDFVSAGDRGWRTTLVAIPSEDAAPILDAIADLGWTLRSVTLVGTQSPRFDANDSVVASVTWSEQRGCFAVFQREQLVFHYDLGPMPAKPSGLSQGVTPGTTATWQRWIDSLGVAVTDALDFHLNVNPTNPPLRLILYGLPMETAPFLSEWNARFPEGVAVSDPTESHHDGLPDGVAEWLKSNPGVIAPVARVLAGGTSLDLTPPNVVQQRNLYRRERVARSVAVVSLAACLAWTGMIWSHIGGYRAEVERSRVALEQLQTSPVSIRLDQAMGTVAHTRAMLSTITSPSVKWTPWLRTILHTMPVNASLQHLDCEYREDTKVFVAHLEGTLAPSREPYAITYRGWLDALRPLCTSTPLLVSERTYDVAGSKWSAFTLQLQAPLGPSTEGGHIQ